MAMIFGNPVALTLGLNTITVAAVTFDRTVKFQFSSGDVEFDALSLNGNSSACVVILPPSSTSLISNCIILSLVLVVGLMFLWRRSC